MAKKIAPERIKKVVPDMMLYEHIRDKLNNDGILRDIAKDNDVIWQQMPFDYFNSLIKSKSLYTKPHSDFRDYDEKKLVQYMSTCYYLDKSHPRYTDLKNKLNEIDKNTYVSCWYNAKDLSDIVFKQYAGSDTGVAIGTTVGALVNCIKKNKHKGYVGNVQYVYHNELEKKKIFENTQIVCPFFLKGMQFYADNEFRLCIRGVEGQFNGQLNVCLMNLIKQIAIKNDGVYKDMKDCEVAKIFNRKVNRIGLSVGQIIRENGFIIMKMRKNSMKLLSGKYDSTKQRAVLLQGNRQGNFRRYTASLRMEMLITGGVLVTDAQFYDGLYFAWMARNKDIDQFAEFAQNTGMFKIMQRDKNPDVALTKMCCKEFLFSSIESKKLQAVVQEIGKDYQISNDVLKRTKENNIDDYLKNMSDTINQVYGEIYDDEWRDFEKGIKNLYGAVQSHPEIVVPWDTSDENYFKYKELLSQNIDKDNRYIDKIKAVINEYQNLLSSITFANKYFAAILYETEKDFPNRSAIEENFNKLQELANQHLSPDKIQRAEEIKNKYNRLFNDRYNKGLAIQHYAGFLDVCDYHQHIKNIVDAKKIDIKTINISAEIIKKLANMSWDDFEKIVLKDTIINKKKVFLDAYYDATVNDDEFVHLLKAYIDELVMEITKITITRDETEQPWNYQDTNNNYLDDIFTENKDISFVGGGSFIEGENADSVCLFRDICDNVIYCIQIGASDNANLDTVIAPVKNIFNGN